MLRILVAASHPQAWGHGVARRPIRTQLGAPNSRASGPLFVPPSIRPSRGPPLSLPVVPLIGDKRYYGEAPVGLRRCERAVVDAVPPITPKMPVFILSGIPSGMGGSTESARNPPFRRKRLMESRLRPSPPPFDRPNTRWSGTSAPRCETSAPDDRATLGRGGRSILRQAEFGESWRGGKKANPNHRGSPRRPASKMNGSTRIPNTTWLPSVVSGPDHQAEPIDFRRPPSPTRQLRLWSPLDCCGSCGPCSATMLIGQSVNSTVFP
jgi:hypothetical protein